MSRITLQQQILDFSNHQNYNKLIGTDLSRQTNMRIPQQINFTGKLEDDRATMFLLPISSKKLF